MENQKSFWEKCVEKRIENGIHKGFRFFFHFLFGVAFFTLFGAVVMWLWNCLLPQIFGLTTITFWQALGIFALSKILLGGCGFFDRHFEHKHHNAFRNKWLKMNDKERCEFYRRFGHEFFEQKNDKNNEGK
ncbi:MAG: hypothetical protein LBS50_07735 [Prevotellaceae bacterium]|jgi:hypothetical protein|nr:hypothetical protein [Prevotellaceae bacterium]